jgi:hypothetical protein
MPVVLTALDREYMHGAITRSVFCLLNQWL